MLAMGSIATVIACIAAAALALGARLVSALIRGRGTDLMTRPLGFQHTLAERLELLPVVVPWAN